MGWAEKHLPRLLQGHAKGLWLNLLPTTLLTEQPPTGIPPLGSSGAKCAFPFCS